ncbi:Lrp/AsnC family transcriptional regulator [Limobrevibacterium gyesilva]|uniref:Lrp/AsnC family transcriptional regulator n=1 Tax=Limobrevibacterium gyesilva TaxID=2991712 RepID=A0AA42CDN6_9PROT|nr:Lrp/AsnC family transcriptional regulator [Limobrevibacterium gyesilva]MCW3475083.1 Lrp/AsnC family transcriptional regulator [Limobrevibacterium gyesilva]
MLDRTDRRILRLLQQDGRMTNQNLSEHIGMSPSPCLRRLRALEERGVIRGYTAILDQKACGLPLNVFTSIRLNRQSEDDIAEFETAIAGWDEVVECYLMTGTRDYLLRVVVEGLEAYERFLKQRMTRLKCIGSIESNFAMGTVKKTASLPLKAD